jgi:division protein CdvB (Snf7/Vps24/ESCRT-III family)
MDIASTAGSAAAMQQAQTGSEVGIKMLDKANEMAGDQANKLIDSLPAPKSASAPGVGGGIDVSA